jgi:hypothetical protein
LHPVGQVGGDAAGLAVLGQVVTVPSTLPGSCPMITTLPPAATTSAAVWRPIPLLPPTTTSFCPEKTGVACARSGWSACGCRPCSQFQFALMFDRSFRLGGEHHATVPPAGPRSNPPMAGHDG